MFGNYILWGISIRFLVGPQLYSLNAFWRAIMFLPSAVLVYRGISVSVRSKAGTLARLMSRPIQLWRDILFDTSRKVSSVNGMFRSVFRLSPRGVLEAGILTSLPGRTSASSSGSVFSPFLRKNAATAETPRPPLRSHEPRPSSLTSAPLEQTPSTRVPVCLKAQFSICSGRAILFHGLATVSEEFNFCAEETR